MADKIKCPIHGNELTLEQRENLLVAICNCEVPNNPYKGKAVYQKPADKYSAAPVKSAFSSGKNTNKGESN